jgi:hypothetical protein
MSALFSWLDFYVSKMAGFSGAHAEEKGLRLWLSAHGS